MAGEAKTSRRKNEKKTGGTEFNVCRYILTAGSVCLSRFVWIVLVAEETQLYGMVEV